MKPKVKLVILILVSTCMLIFPNFLLILIATLVTFALIFACGVKDKFMSWTKPLSLVFVVVILLQSFTYGGLGFSIEGFHFGILYAMRVLALLTLVFLFVQTTTISKLAEAFDFLPKSISQVLVLALALMPSVTNLTENIINAQKSRAMSFRTLNVFRTYFPVLVPLFAKMLYRSEHMSLAMQARGYGD